MHLLKSIYQTFFYAPNVAKQPSTVQQLYTENKEKLNDKRDLEEVKQHIDDYVEVVQESILKATENLVEKTILIGGGSLLLMGNIMLSDKFYLSGNISLFKFAYITISISILLAVASFLLDIFHGSLVLSADQAGKGMENLFNEYKTKVDPSMPAEEIKNIRDEYLQLIQNSYQDFVKFTKIGLKALQGKNLLLFLACVVFLLGFSIFLIFGWLNIDNFKVET